MNAFLLCWGVFWLIFWSVPFTACCVSVHRGGKVTKDDFQNALCGVLVSVALITSCVLWRLL